MDYIKLSRKILDWEWYSDINTKVLFLHMLLKANWKDGRFQGVNIPRGSFVSSYHNLSSETGLSVRNVRTSLEHLKSTGEVTVNRQAKFSVFTINNYCSYQSGDKVTDSQVTKHRQATDSQVTTIEEGKKERREEYNSFSKEKPSAESKEPEHIFTTIRELYSSVCVSYPRLVKMSDRRKKAIRARMNTGYTLDDFERLFQKAEASDFLKGRNNRNWRADFDWLINDSNMAKVLEGKYDNAGGRKNDTGRKTESVEKGYIQQVVEGGYNPGEFEGF